MPKIADNNEDCSWKKIAATTGAKVPPKNLLSTAFFRGGKEKRGNEALLRGQEKGERKSLLLKKPFTQGFRCDAALATCSGLRDPERPEKHILPTDSSLSGRGTK